MHFRLDVGPGARRRLNLLNNFVATAYPPQCYTTEPCLWLVMVEMVSQLLLILSEWFFGPDATSHIDLESLYDKYGFNGLIGKRLNIIEEVHGNYYQSNKLKKLISGEAVTIDKKYKDMFTFRPQVKFAFSVNMLPRVDDTSTGTERRILAVQFLNNYRDNPNLALRSSVGLLAQELPGILNWMIEGAIDLSNDKKFITTQEQIRMS